MLVCQTGEHRLLTSDGGIRLNRLDAAIHPASRPDHRILFTFDVLRGYWKHHCAC